MESRQLCDAVRGLHHEDFQLLRSPLVDWLIVQSAMKNHGEEQLGKKTRECPGRQAGEGRCDGQKEWANLSFCRLDFQWTCSLPLPLFPLLPFPVVERCAAFSPVSLRLLSPPGFRYKSLSGCYTSAFSFFFPLENSFELPQNSHIPSCVWKICGFISQTSDLPFNVLGFLLKSECADTVTVWPQPVYTAGKGRTRSASPPSLTLIPVTIFFLFKINIGSFVI